MDQGNIDSRKSLAESHVRKQFSFCWSKENLQFSCVADVPITSGRELNDLAGMLGTVHKIPVFAQEDFKTQLGEFIQREYKAFQNKLADEALATLLGSNLDITKTAKKWQAEFQKSFKEYAPPRAMSDEDVFRNAYQTVLKADSKLVRKVLAKETVFAAEMQQIIRERDTQVDALQKQHTTALKGIMNEAQRYSDHQINRIASDHFERIQNLEAEYTSKIASLAMQQKTEFRTYVVHLYEQYLLGHEHETTRKTSSVIEPTREHAPSISKPHMEESFTINLGAQQKTMHNLRLVAVDPMQFCLHRKGAFEESQRWNIALTLYTDHLSGLVLLVDSRPTYHISFHTEFAKACEQAAELHFDDLETQIQQVEKSLVKGNEHRASKRNSADGSAETASLSSGSTSSEKQTALQETLKVGDVYLTRHSNLAQIHLVFHLVVDDAIKHNEINSRHPCINGIRNVIRLCTKFGVTNIAIPLLMIHHMTEEITIPWCLKRAELIFKCTKGFMMECFTLSSGDHLTVQFLVPPEISPELFAQLAEMLSGIFRMASAVVGVSSA